MTSLQAVKSDAATYLSDDALPHKLWASYAFPGRRFDHVTLNLSEISNSALRFQRELPPLQLMAAIYAYEMEHFQPRLLKAST
ncbi:hypothetical protein A4X09_0g7399 [Tilletia walkeri]|uniref:Uncharacterized protein n=1 Tax=Tilletia walkeri TaxID=117179 RepID=A0A8X7N3B2_9BASI|nr:hypothetical protein A4X09_0g7399 [Tilletia walkeri]